MRNRLEIEATDAADERVLLDRRGLVLKALALGGGVVAAAALAPADALADEGAPVLVGKLAENTKASPVFYGWNRGAGRVHRHPGDHEDAIFVQCMDPTRWRSTLLLQDSGSTAVETRPGSRASR